MSQGTNHPFAFVLNKSIYLSRSRPAAAVTELSHLFASVVSAAAKGFLMFIADNGSVTTVKEDTMTPDKANDLLLDSAKTGKVDNARVALAAGANVKAKAAFQQAPLHWAAAYGYTDVAQLLIENGADINAKDMFRQTPLHHAAAGGYTDMARLLIKNGADVDAKDTFQKTPLHLAAARGRTDIVNLLENAATRHDGGGPHIRG